MLKQMILRFAALCGLCVAATVFLLNPPGGVTAILAYSLAETFFYAFSWVKELLKWLMAFTGKYGFLSILFGSLPAILIILVIFIIGLPLLCMAWMILGGASGWRTTSGMLFVWISRGFCPVTMIR